MLYFNTNVGATLKVDRSPDSSRARQNLAGERSPPWNSRCAQGFLYSTGPPRLGLRGQRNNLRTLDNVPNEAVAEWALSSVRAVPSNITRDNLIPGHPVFNRPDQVYDSHAREIHLGSPHETEKSYAKGSCGPKEGVGLE